MRPFMKSLGVALLGGLLAIWLIVLLTGQTIISGDQFPGLFLGSLTVTQATSADTTAETSPSNENQQGKVFHWDPATSSLKFRFPKVDYGPSALDATTGNIALPNNVNTLVASGIPGDGIGMRSGLAAYIPKGHWNLYGQVVISYPAGNIVFEVTVTQGTTICNAVTQPRILCGAPVIVGGGMGTSPSVANAQFSIPFSTTSINNNSAVNQAAEILVFVKPLDVVVETGSALSTSGGVPQGQASHFIVLRLDGFP